MLMGGLEYLNLFLKELIRKYSSLPVLDRECLPPQGETGYSLEPYSDFRIPPGMPVYIPVSAIQNDPQVRIFVFEYTEPNFFLPAPRKDCQNFCTVFHWESQ